MENKSGYGQYCPISVAAEVIAHKWTPLVLRSLFCGCRHYNEISKSIPRMSSALLSRRLKELEYAGIIKRIESDKTPTTEYHLTQAGQELFPVLDRMGAWAQTWLRREITKDDNLDPDVLMWEFRQLDPQLKETSSQRRVVKFHLNGVPIKYRFYWLVFEPKENEVCVKDPGYDVDLNITAHIRTLVEIWMGHKTIAQARSNKELVLEGSNTEVRAFNKWFSLSHFARYGDAIAKS